jgi:hypothetical protein
VDGGQRGKKKMEKHCDNRPRRGEESGRRFPRNSKQERWGQKESKSAALERGKKPKSRKEKARKKLLACRKKASSRCQKLVASSVACDGGLGSLGFGFGKALTRSASLHVLSQPTRSTSTTTPDGQRRLLCGCRRHLDRSCGRAPVKEDSPIAELASPDGDKDEALHLPIMEEVVGGPEQSPHAIVTISVIVVIVVLGERKRRKGGRVLSRAAGTGGTVRGRRRRFLVVVVDRRRDAFHLPLVPRVHHVNFVDAVSDIVRVRFPVRRSSVGVRVEIGRVRVYIAL